VEAWQENKGGEIMLGSDLERQIEIHTMRKEMYTTEREYMLKKLYRGPAGYKEVDMSGMPHGSGGEHTLDVIIKDLEHYQNMIDLEVWAIESLTKLLEGINTSIDKLEGLDSKVVYMRDFNGYRLQEIADKLGYSLDRIKQVSCRNSKGCKI
jgi:hypothetical protein